MTNVIVHARYVTSDFDQGNGPGQLFDEDARVGTIHAYRQALCQIRALAKLGRGPQWRDARYILRPALMRIARNYWQDFDYDDRKNSAKVKAEVGKLIGPLKAAVKALDELPPYARRALNFEIARSGSHPVPDGQDVYATILATTRALQKAAHIFSDRDHRKTGGALRFRNACRELAALWEEVFGKPFPRNVKTAPGTDGGGKREFESPGANFVYIVLYEIGNRWVTVSQVEEGLKALRKGK